jgi:hypothetical protein
VLSLWTSHLHPAVIGMRTLFFSFFGFFWVVFGEHFLVMCALYALML